ncbi:uncharacterized protein TRIADDRAFT_51668 [Trichoplax adhaerens]|uniref:G-protein coupled receptors family 1 profile domain-containing protein n=1 Tax=Trichoplax adhaerens TaxID=10228 RepID=B3RKG1_TRIAD|nr:hypothetical protein TRIADDRAFT_51668 [Trichoplax adhaerens]EDV29399.1 hypothetical protein TRIADDRAFT_51668 [Trichoplax adhaerens]|eukprot:XP_002108601.1 hypothetical protein TRIADDRAFT_51668 [Trichoplax adhaerens]
MESKASFIPVIAIVGNLFYLITLYKNPSLQNRINNNFIGNLAAADLLTGLLAIPMVLTVIIMGSSVPSTICQAQAFLVGWFYGVSLTIAAVISIDRCIIVVQPLRYPNLMTPNKVKVLIIFPWVFSLIIYIVPLLGLENVGLGRYGYKDYCRLDSSIISIAIEREEENCSKGFAIGSPEEALVFGASDVIASIYLIHLILVISIVVGCYSIIFYIACQKNLACDRNRARSIIKSIRTTATIVGTNLFCWIPTTVLTILDLSDFEIFNLLPFKVSVIFYILFLATAATNPIIYIWRSHELRNRVITTVCYKRNRIMHLQRNL